MGKTLGEIDAMPQPEFLSWCEFYRLYPFDDLHRYHRPAALVSVSMGGGSVKDRLDWLHPLPSNPDAEIDFFALQRR